MTVDSVIQNAMGRVFPAAQVVVRCRGQVVLARADGWLDPETRRRPVQADTLFDLGSVTKLFVGTTFMTLVEEGRVGLDQPVCSVLPEFDGPRPLRAGEAPRGAASRADSAPPPPGATADAGRVTFRQLLAHCAGLPAWRPLFREQASADAVRDAVLRTWFSSPPGTRTVYSDLGFALLGFAIARLTGLALDAAVHRRVTEPLQLDRTGYRRVWTVDGTHRHARGDASAPVGGGVYPGAAASSRPEFRGARQCQSGGGAPAVDDIAPTELCPWRQRRVKGEVHDETAAALGGVAGHAGLFSTASDVAAFGQAFLAMPEVSAAGGPPFVVPPSGGLGEVARRAPGPPEGGTTSLLRAETIAEMTRPQGEGGTSRRGLGFALWSADADASGQPFSPSAFGHTGFTGTTLWVDPARELVVACLTNRVYYGRSPGGITAFRIALHRAIVAAVDRQAAFT